MKKISCLIAIAFALSTGSALAETKKEPSPAQRAQQEKMKNCNKEAAEKKLAGDPRKAFMKECLSAKPAAAKADEKSPPASCEAQATEKKLAGAAKTSFLKKCETDAKTPPAKAEPKNNK